ncbi:MAG: hypothetical protein AAGF44_01715 [Pseudomonadota bacterium]
MLRYPTRVEAGYFHYEATCLLCGKKERYSYRDLRDYYGGNLPQRRHLESALICVCHGNAGFALSEEIEARAARHIPPRPPHWAVRHLVPMLPAKAC